jgi:ribosomal protein L29
MLYSKLHLNYHLNQKLLTIYKMSETDKKSMISEIYNLKKELLLLRMKITSGDKINLKDYREKKKKIAIIFTTLNKKA